MPSSVITIARPTVNSLPLADVPFELLFRALDIQNVVLLWQCVLLEFKVVLHSKHVALLGVVCECITALLYPFKWFHIYIPLLPLPLVQYVHCPCPYVIGVNVAKRSDIDIPEEAVVVDLDNNVITLPSPPPPSLPEKQKNKLIKKLKKKASIFEKPGEFSDGFDFGSYFVKRTAVNLTNAKPKDNKKKDTKDVPGVNSKLFDEQGMRQAFLQFFVSIMKNYRKAIVDNTFNLPTFLKTHPGSSEEFVTHLCTQSQGFQQFMNSRKTVSAPDTSDIVLFDEYIIQKKNRTHHLAKDKETPFLHDTSQTVVRTYEVPPVDTAHLTQSSYQYPTFPRLSESVFVKDIKEAPQLVDQATGAFKSRVPNKELAILWDIVNATSSPKPRGKSVHVKLFNRGSKDLYALWSKKHLGKKYDQVIANVITIQAYHKAKLQRKGFKALRLATQPLQNEIRAWGVRHEYSRLQQYSLFIQSVLRGSKPRVEYQQKRASALSLQTRIRSQIARKAFESLCSASLLLQTLARRVLSRRGFLEQKSSAVVFQTATRTRLAQGSLCELRGATVQLQACIRKALQASAYSQYKKKVILAQAVVRRHKVKKQVATMLAAQFNEVKLRLLALWHVQQVPKLHRAVCLVICDSVTISNLFMLLEDEKQWQNSSASSSASATKKGETQPSKALQVEQQQLINALQRYHPSEGGINSVYVQWGVDSTGQKRKPQLCEKLFAHPADPVESMQSAELLCKLAGVYDRCRDHKGHSHRHLQATVAACADHLASLSSESQRRCCVLQ